MSILAQALGQIGAILLALLGVFLTIVLLLAIVFAVEVSIIAIKTIIKKGKETDENKKD